jgi:hypothetical protein
VKNMTGQQPQTAAQRSRTKNALSDPIEPKTATASQGHQPEADTADS